jgi:peptide/nickel transport system substrate-binding protein
MAPTLVRRAGNVKRSDRLTRPGRRRSFPVRGENPVSFRVRLLVVLALLSTVAPAAAAPEGQLTWGVHTTLVPAYFDPAETTIGTSFMVLYGIHDALVKPLPGKGVAPALAEAWSVSPDGLVYDFVLRKGARFHNGDPVTAEDARFSFERYRGIHARTLKDRVAAVETPDAGRLRIRLKQPWPDFMTYFGTVTTSAAWVVPKKYVEKVGDDGFKKAPIGAGPYRFVSFTPGIELVLEAFDGYWRKAPAVKRLVFRVIPDPSTRLVALKRGEADVVFSMIGELADEVRRTPGLSLKPVYPSTHWLSFPDQWDPKSPWHDRRVRLAANHAIDRPAIDQARTGGLSRITFSIVAGAMDFFWQPPAYPFDPARARRLLAEAGYPNGFDAGDYSCDMTSTDAAETVMGFLQAVGIRARLRPLERAAFNKSLADRKLKNLVQIIAGVAGNAATRLETYLASTGAFAAGGAPDLDGLLREQATEVDRARREAILKTVQQLVHERAMFAPLYDLAFVNGLGPRVEESGLGLIAGYAFSAPYEDVKLKAR